MKEKAAAFVKKELVFCISLLLALASMAFAPPSAAYLSYIDWHTILLLFCLMAVAAGFSRSGLLGALSRAIAGRAGSLRGLAALLTLLTFFSSMAVTNDVALLAFVPLTLAVLKGNVSEGRLAAVLVLQTAAANLGSMATPVGNPQNLYLYSQYSMGFEEFFPTVLPIAGVSLALLLLACLCVGASPLAISFPKKKEPLPAGKCAVYGVLFLLCLLSVFHLLPDAVTLAAVLLAALAMDRRVLGQVDYFLLLTFLCFFVFAGNLQQLDAAARAISSAMEGREFLVSAAVSQVVSNVPAAVMLSAFTENGRALLAGVNVGGLGTPVASLASLITLKLYLNSPGARAGRYLALFLTANFILLFLLGAFVLVAGLA